MNANPLDLSADELDRRLREIDLRWLRVAVLVFAPFLRWYYRVEVRGLEHATAYGRPVLYVANHNAGYVLDILALLYAIKPWLHPDTKIVAMGRGGPVDAPIFKQIIRRIGGIPDSLANARAVLRRKCWVLVCPGGVREVVRPIWQRNSVRFEWQRSYARLAQSEGCPVVPIAISGSHETVPVLWNSRMLWKIIPGARQVVPGAGTFPITLDHAINLLVFLALPISHGIVAWVIFLMLNIYVDLVFFWPWLPAKIRIRFGPPIHIVNGDGPVARARNLQHGHRCVVAALESMLMQIHHERPWPKFLV